jgi:hypothetical protein
MATAKKTKKRPASAAAPKRKAGMAAANGAAVPAPMALEKLIAESDIIELKALAQMIEKRLRELRLQAPDPVMEDWKWIFEQSNRGALRPYLDQTIAVLNRKIIWSGDNSLDLRESLANEHGVDPERIVIFFVG